jgi:N-carbamoylputrescine amidase
MKITVCELRNRPEEFAADWERLAAHVKAHQSDLVLLPEMAFSPWFAWRRKYDPRIWDAAVSEHVRWKSRLQELGPAVVLGSAPVQVGNRRFNQGFLWRDVSGFKTVHTKSYLPDEKGFWEASWYDAGEGRFNPVQAGNVKIGFTICSEIWFFQHARRYGQQGVQMIVCPRATPRETLSKWVAAGCAAAVVSGAFCISSNRVSGSKEKANLGGQSWIVGPDGEILARTSPGRPFVTVKIDLNRADRAKYTYPRYIKDKK